MQVPPPPQDVAQRWAAFGIVVLVAGGATCAATSFKAHFAPPPPDPPAAPEYVPAKSAPPVLVEEGPGDEIEAPPERLGTPQASLAARPAWASAQYAPEHSRARELFAAARPLGGDLERAFVVCRAHTTDRAHPLALDDLRLRATFGTAPAVTNKGLPDDENVVMASAPLVNLRKGEWIGLEIWVHDAEDGNAPITKRTLRFAGAPISFTDARATAECRALSGEPLEKAAATDLDASQTLVRKLSSQHLAGHLPGWGWPLEIARAQNATSDAAALVGWDDYRVKRRVHSITANIARLESERPSVFGQLRARAGVEASVLNAKAAFARIECRGTCVVSMHVKNTTELGWEWASPGGPSGWIATATSGPVALVVEPSNETSIFVPPGGEKEIRLVAADRKIDPTKEPVVVGICSSVGCDALMPIAGEPSSRF